MHPILDLVTRLAVIFLTNESPLDRLLEAPYGEPKPPEMEFSLLAMIFTALLGVLVGVAIVGDVGPVWVRWIAMTGLALLGGAVLYLSR